MIDYHTSLRFRISFSNYSSLFIYTGLCFIYIPLLSHSNSTEINERKGFEMTPRVYTAPLFIKISRQTSSLYTDCTQYPVNIYPQTKIHPWYIARKQQQQRRSLKNLQRLESISLGKNTEALDKYFQPLYVYIYMSELQHRRTCLRGIIFLSEKGCCTQYL